MSLEIICPHCGHPNSIGKIFCSACGGNMQAGRKAPKMRQTRKPGGAGSPLKPLFVMFKLLLALGTAALVVGIFYPVESAGRKGTRQEAEQYSRRINQIDEHINRIKAGQHPEPVFNAAFKETELNAILAKTVEEQAAPPGGMAMRVAAVRVSLEKPDIVVLHLDNRLFEDKLRMTFEATYIAEVEGDRVRFRVHHARIGHVPFPGPLAAIVSSKFKVLFQDALQEKQLLESAENFEIDNNTIRFKLNVR